MNQAELQNGTPPSDHKKRPRRRMPTALAVIYGTTLLSGLVYLSFRLFPPFADLFNGTVAAFIRRILAYLTNLLPFSLAETMILALPLALAVALYVGLKYHNDTLRDALVYCGSMLAAVCILLQLFVYAFAPGYFATGVDRKLGFERKDVSPEELYETATELIGHVNAESEGVFFMQDGFSIMPYTHYTMNEKLLDAYEKVSEEYDAVKTFRSSTKPVLFSKVMSYMHITGVYTCFTGEANVNVDFPDYTIPYTAAHELAHQRGFAREDEANFIAFLVCTASDDAYIRYSGYVAMYEYVMSALARADRELYTDARAEVAEVVLAEGRAYAEFYKQYRNSTLGEVSGAINNSYLQIQGTVGTKSYGMVVDLAVAYFKRDAD